MSKIRVKLNDETKELEYKPDMECPFCVEGDLGEGFPGDQCFMCGALVTGIYGTKKISEDV